MSNPLENGPGDGGLEESAEEPGDEENDAIVQVRVLNGGFTGAVYIPNQEGPFPSTKQIHLAIEKARVVFGINDKAIDKLIKGKIRGKAIIIAKGKMPGDGGSARLIWNDITEDGASPQDITDQVIQGQRLQLFSRVKAGDQVLSKLPFTAGAKGTNVFGQSVVLEGGDIPMPSGKGTSLSQDGLTLIADQEGVAHWDGEVVTVIDMQFIKGDVDEKTGNIKADGLVYVEKDVTAGMHLEAMGDIFIGGSIKGADVYSRSGTVRVRHGILGDSKARVLAGANVVASYIEDATIGAKENVEVDRYILNSAVTAGRYVLALINEGKITGGSIFAEKKIELKLAGSQDLTETELRVGFMPAHVQTKEKYQLHADQRRNRMELATVQKRLAFLNILKQRMGTLTPDKDIQFRDLERQEKVLQHEHKRHIQLGDNIERQETKTPDEEIETESIRVHDTIFPSVILGIGDATMVMNKERRNVLVYRAGDIISYGPLDQAMRKKPNAG